MHNKNLRVLKLVHAMSSSSEGEEDAVSAAEVLVHLYIVWVCHFVQTYRRRAPVTLFVVHGFSLDVLTTACLLPLCSSFLSCHPPLAAGSTLAVVAMG